MFGIHVISKQSLIQNVDCTKFIAQRYKHYSHLYLLAKTIYALDWWQWTNGYWKNSLCGNLCQHMTEITITSMSTLAIFSRYYTSCSINATQEKKPSLCTICHVLHLSLVVNNTATKSQEGCCPATWVIYLERTRIVEHKANDNITVVLWLVSLLLCCSYSVADSMTRLVCSSLHNALIPPYICISCLTVWYKCLHLASSFHSECTHSQYTSAVWC